MPDTLRMWGLCRFLCVRVCVCTCVRSCVLRGTWHSWCQVQSFSPGCQQITSVAAINSFLSHLALIAGSDKSVAVLDASVGTLRHHPGDAVRGFVLGFYFVCGWYAVTPPYTNMLVEPNAQAKSFTGSRMCTRVSPTPWLFPPRHRSPRCDKTRSTCSSRPPLTAASLCVASGGVGAPCVHVCVRA